MIKKLKCKVCGAKTEFDARNRYEVVKTEIRGYLFERVCYEAFDCKKCGCQHLVNIREKRKEDEK